MRSFHNESLTRDQACELLAGVLRTLAPQHRNKLEELKKRECESNRPDFIWHSLLESFATMGSSRGYAGLIDDSSNYNKVTFEALFLLSPPDRWRTLKETLRVAKVRMPDKKAEWLRENFERISTMGGPLAARAELFSRTTAEDKIKFLKRFKGIGPKYARNILMIVYDPQFRNFIAVDDRIKSISKSLGLSFRRSYPEEQQFYLDVAARAGLSGWDVDRLIYSFAKEVASALEVSAN
jgi:endonuclease III